MKVYKVICIAALAVILYLLYAVCQAPVIAFSAKGIQYAEAVTLLLAGLFFGIELFVKQPLFLRLRRGWRIAIIITVSVFLTVSLFLEVLILTGVGSAGKEGKPEAILVLGCGLLPDGKPTATLRLRLLKAAEEAKQNPSLPVILTGGMCGEEPIPEASAMADFLSEQGIDPQRMIMESNSTVTRENFRFSRPLVPWRDPAHPCVFLVTTDYHMFRSCWTGRDQGFVCIPCPAEPYKRLWIIDHPREQLGIIKHFIVRSFHQQ